MYLPLVQEIALTLLTHCEAQGTEWIRNHMILLPWLQLTCCFIFSLFSPPRSWLTDMLISLRLLFSFFLLHMSKLFDSAVLK